MPFWMAGFTLLNLLLVLPFVHLSGAARRLDAIALVIQILAVVFWLPAPAPINHRIATWTPASLPADWREQEHRWDVYHWLRTGGLRVAFLLLALSLPCLDLRICAELFSSEGGPPGVKISPMSHKLAFLTVGVLHDPVGTPRTGPRPSHSTLPSRSTPQVIHAAWIRR